jgi:glutathione S-transferase
VSVKYAGLKAWKLTSNGGLGPNPKDAPGYWTDYSIPAITYEDGTSQMDSWPIAHELEKRYPSPSLHLDDPITVKIRDLIGSILNPVILQFLPYVPDHLPERSREWFYESRNAAFGKPISEVHKEALANADEGWKQCYEPLKEAADLLKKHDGPFFLGQTVSYADFIFTSMLFFVKLLDESAFDKIVSQDPAFSKLYEATSQWFAKDN